MEMITENTVMGEDVKAKLKELPQLYSTEGVRGDRPALRFFYAFGPQEWVVWEYDPEDDVAFGWCDLGMGMGELGTVSIAELRDLFPGTIRIPIECDILVSKLSDAVDGWAPGQGPRYLLEPEGETS